MRGNCLINSHTTEEKLEVNKHVLEAAALLEVSMYLWAVIGNYHGDCKHLVQLISSYYNVGLNDPTVLG